MRGKNQLFGISGILFMGYPIFSLAICMSLGAMFGMVFDKKKE